MQVEVNCFSCRDPYGLLAEIVIDNKTVDSLTYDPSTSTCYHAKGMCRPDICSCFSNNQFIRQLTVDLLTPKLFSCMMSFVDIYTESKISKTAGIYFDGKGNLIAIFKPKPRYVVISISQILDANKNIMHVFVDKNVKPLNTESELKRVNSLVVPYSF